MAKDRILVIDDNVDNLLLTEILLESEGFEVRTAQDATLALAALEECRPNLILMDVQLPGMDGLELTRRLKQERAWRDIPVVALTSYAMSGDEEKARAAGCSGYVTKPIDTRQFAAEVGQYLRHGVENCLDPEP